MWHDVAMNLIMFSHDSCLNGTHKYFESQIDLKIRVALYSNELQIENKLNKLIIIVFIVTFDVLDVF